MPFKTFQYLLLLVLISMMLLYQAVVLPGYFGLVLAFALFLPLLFQSRVIIGKLLVAAGGGVMALLFYQSITSNDLVVMTILIANSFILLSFAFSLSFLTHFSLYIAATITMALLALFYPLSPMALVLLIGYLFVFVSASFALLLRHDIEHHHIIKHRLGLDSHRVEVGRLLSSKKVLDRDLGSFLFLFSGIIAIIGVVIAWIILPFFPMEGFGTARRAPRFPQIFDLNNSGRVTTSSTARVFLESETPTSKRRIYLKGRVLGAYSRGVWYPVEDHPRRPSPEHNEVHGVFTVSSTFGGPRGFTPWSTVWAKGKSPETCRINTDGTLSHPTGSGTHRCRVGVQFAPLIEDFTRPVYSRTLGIPLRILQLGKTLGQGLGTTHEKITAVRTYLGSYQYGDKYIKPPLGADPVAQFLFEEKRGPCGLFASSAALLLRAMGERTRLVTGFSRVTEGKITRFRGSDAHSWSEVFIPGRGWEILDPTVHTRRAIMGPTPMNISKAGFFRTAALLLPIVCLIIGLLVIFIRKHNPVTTSGKNLSESRAPRPARAPSFTTLQASMIFSEIISLPPFAAVPRSPGESAVNYALRLQSLEHPLASQVLQASQTANSLLFGTLETSLRARGLEDLQTIFEKIRLSCN
ncbi:transglutaminase-like domain-containing protein [Myxococcota bacterium]|nr:transglutaminase-like domain-containing protein [Myxococcota bacterium]MBU1534371.1 transglutaminase-like domain-containing protein [Myxococcota bacterium]